MKTLNQYLDKFFYYNNQITKMMKKKENKLLEIVKKDDQFHLLDFLDIQDLNELSLTNKKYYLQLLPYIQSKKLDQKLTDNSNQIKQTKKQKRNKNIDKNINQNKNQKQTQVNIDAFNFKKWSKNNKTEEWEKIDQLPFYNSYLQKKLQTKTDIFFKNKETGKLMFINRSLIDPNLDFEKGSFNDQLQEDIYEHLYEQCQLNEVDLSTKQGLLKRQKQLLNRINKKKQENVEKQTISFQKQLQRALDMKRFAIILCFGGSFSIAIYEGEKCIIHKSDKKYVCRKKAGQRQFNKDKQSGSNIKSMGSQIRRDQQKKHVINVNQILNQYKEDLNKCEIIFLQAPGMNRLCIINENQTMAKLQNKLRSVCVTAKKANFTQVQQIFEKINKIRVVRLEGQQKQEKKLQ